MVVLLQDRQRSATQRAAISMPARTHFFGIEVLFWAVYVLSQTPCLEAFGYGCLYDVLQRIICVATELARVAVVGEGHCRVWA